MCVYIYIYMHVCIIVYIAIAIAILKAFRTSYFGTCIGGCFIAGGFEK